MKLFQKDALFKTAGAIALAGLVSIQSLAFAATGGEFAYTKGATFHQKKFYIVDHKQDIAVDFRIDVNGNGHFNARFSNGKKIDGDHFYAKVVLTDKDGQLVGVGQHRVGLNPSYFGKTRVRNESRIISLGADVAKRIVKVRYEVGHFDTVDDGAFWKKAVELGGALIGSTQNGFLVLPSNSGLKAIAPTTF